MYCPHCGFFHPQVGQCSADEEATANETRNILRYLQRQGSGHRPVMRFVLTCASCGRDNRLGPAAYIESDVLSLVCAGCRASLDALVVLPPRPVDDQGRFEGI